MVRKREEKTEELKPVSTDPVSRDETGFYAAYSEFAKNLRIWFLAYGIGATAIFVTNEGAGKKLLASGAAEWVVYLFLTGVGVQILMALLYKTAMWYLYEGELEPEKKGSRRYKFSESVSDNYLLELCCDLLTILCFGGATYFLVQVFIR